MWIIPNNHNLYSAYAREYLGLEKGIERAIGKLRTIAYVEIEAFIIANLVAQMESGLLDAAPIWTNVKTFDARQFRNKIHGIIGGYPCQPFSQAGERRGSEDPRHLWPYIQNIISTIRPFWCFFENVSGHLTMGFDEVYRSLRDMGYSVEAGIFTAEEIGAPHQRERIFILAMANTSNARQQISRLASSPKLSEESKTGMDNRFKQRGIELGDAQSGEQQNVWAVAQTGYRENRGSGEQLDYSFQQGLEGYSGNDSGENRRKEQERPVTAPSIFPAGQGHFQYEFEESRTIKSGMVYTVDGYNFTEDLHRAIGNSVVEQTAELAFISLLDKHLNNIKP